MNLKQLAINELIINVWIGLMVLMVGIRTVRTCNVDMCSREYSSVLAMAQQWSTPSAPPSRESAQQYCSSLNAYQHCLRSIGRSCRGNLEFHTLQTLLKNWKLEHNCSHASSAQPPGKQMVATAQRRSGQSLISSQNSQRSHQQNQQKFVEQQERLQSCLSSAYNYTISSNNGSNASFRISESDQRTKLLSSEQKAIRDEDMEALRVGAEGQRAKQRHRTRVGRAGRSTGSEITVKTNFFPIRGETIDLNEDIDRNEFNSITMPSTAPTVKPSVPPSPPLTCIIYGDPHLRTFNNEYQTCRCSGAWPLIDHPLFAVQITNSKLKGANPQLTGVTKVTVLVRQFSKCGIHSDLLYEADSQPNTGGGQTSSATPSATFIDGSSTNSNNLIRITQSSNNNVITIHLDHIGARVYIGQFENSAFLNVVIKFRSATSTVKQQLVLNSISSNSLCKMGCPKRELIDIQNILTATGIDLNGNSADSSGNSAQQSDNSANDYKSESEPTVMSEADDTGVDQEEGPEEDPCRDLYGYYRISCLYDVTIKGVSDVNNANRFAQSFDEMKFIHNSILNSAVNSVNNNDINVKIIANSSPHPFLSSNHCLNIFLVFVISLISHLL